MIGRISALGFVCNIKSEKINEEKLKYVVCNSHIVFLFNLIKSVHIKYAAVGYNQNTFRR